ncbi:hypothetical protein BC937DRAFT_87432 [Endogone sp. FLAS-F59071]|nr:hypothetical protein BC937DRAFT_87432 [Endogone sp. FLAS-F59071]|eukprot:RUS12608.1 hypothetical protein BC937DRAFT_87432 [Endogone sp. FLAS-F59071]
MDEEPSYRPKIFYTDGLLVGEEEVSPRLFATSMVRPDLSRVNLDISPGITQQPFPPPTIPKEIRLRLRQIRQKRNHGSPQFKPPSFLDYYRHLDEEVEGEVDGPAYQMADVVAEGGEGDADVTAEMDGTGL